LSDNFTLTSPLTIGGTTTLTFTTPISLSTVNLFGGTLFAASDITFTDTFNWSAGFLFGGGKKTIAASATANFTTLNQVKGFTGVIDNFGNVNYSGESLFFSWGSSINSTFNNLPGAIFNATSRGGFRQHFIATNTFNNAGTFNKSGFNTGTAFDGVTFNNTGTVNNPTGSLQFDNITNGGTLNPGGIGSAGLISITGNFTQTSSGTINLDFGGTAAATQFDQLAITGSASLAGTVHVSLINGFAPTDGQSFPFLTASLISGLFAFFTDENPNDQIALNPVYSSTGVNAIAIVTPGPGIPGLFSRTRILDANDTQLKFLVD